MNRFALLTVRRMFSLLYYLRILPWHWGKVKPFFEIFSPLPGNILCNRRVELFRGTGNSGISGNHSQTKVPGPSVKAERTSMVMPFSRASRTLQSWSTCAPSSISRSMRP